MNSGRNYLPVASSIVANRASCSKRAFFFLFPTNPRVGRVRAVEPPQNVFHKFGSPGRARPTGFRRSKRDTGCLSIAKAIVFALAFVVTSLHQGGTGYAALAAEAKPLYQNDFEKSAIGSVPEDFLVLDGAFKVQEEGGNKFLELPGAPLDTFGVLFSSTEKDGLAVSARILGTSKGRRFPTFGVGLNGVGGFKLQVSSAKNLIELSKGDTIRKSVPYDWPPGKWIHLRLEIQQSKSGGWIVAGKVWTSGEPEPATATITSEEKDEPTPGRASIWGSPFSGTPIRYDDLAVWRLPPQP